MSQITVALDRADWLSLADFLSRKFGETVNPLPTMNLLQALNSADETIIQELKQRQERRIRE